MDTAKSLAPQRRGLLRRSWDVFPWALVGGVALGALLRVTVRDGLTGLGFVYYATPPVVMSGLLSLAGVMFATSKRRRLATAIGVAAVLCLAWHRSHALVSPTGGGGSLDGALVVATWNAGRGDAGWDAVADEIDGLAAHVTALQEAGTDDADRRAFWAQRFPDHERAFFGSGLVLLVRGRIVSSRKIDLRDDAKCALVEVEVEGRTLHVLQVDVKRLALTPRATVFEKLDAAIAGITERPLVILGDFNTPRDSVFFDAWRERFDHAFEVAGGGHDATWPLPLPVLAIDHIWCSRDLQVVVCALGSGTGSDHAPVVAYLSIGR